MHDAALMSNVPKRVSSALETRDHRPPLEPEKDRLISYFGMG